MVYLPENGCKIGDIRGKIYTFNKYKCQLKAFDLAGLSGQTLTATQAGTPAFMPRF
ncbi:MAG: hypothetical protein HEQ35_15000 [Gloeotrichia echinulata IR180]|nr:hypothetical protein [Gloeotrichia echinulata DEX184]